MELTAYRAFDMRSDLDILITRDDSPTLVEATDTFVRFRYPDKTSNLFGGDIKYDKLTPMIPSDVNIGDSYFDFFEQYDSRRRLFYRIDSLDLDGETYNDFLDMYDWGNNQSPEELNQYILRGDDKVIGSSSSDYLFGHTGDDEITGGLGKDTLSGGLDADLFIYKTISDSPAGKSRDTIIDFNGGEGDQIDLSAIDGSSKLTGIQELVFIGDSSFSGVGGEVRFSNGILQVETSGDRRADMEIALTGVTSFEASYLIL